jgi:4-alpha-glucanotransferase
MGAIEALQDVPDALARVERDAWHWHIDAVTVAWEGAIPPVRLCCPDEVSDLTALCRIELETGEAREWQVPLESLQRVGARDADGVACVALALSVPLTLPFGYHHLTIEVQGHRLETFIISAPTQAYQATDQRSWGLFLPLYALHTSHSWGIGDFTDLCSLVQWAGTRGAGFVGTLPLLATFLDKPYEHSPYAPVSRLFWNEVYLDPEATIPPAERIAFDADAASKARLLTAFEEVPYRAVMGIKRHALELQAAAYRDNPDLMNFLEFRPVVTDYAMFRAALEKLGPDWHSWPEEERTGFLRPHDFDPDIANYHAFAEWRAQQQMETVAREAAEHRVHLYLDLPVGVHPDGYDAWRFQDLFAQGISVGAPPDLLAKDGQNWGFQPLQPQALRNSGYEYFIAYLRHHLAVAGMLRVDHAIGLHRLFWIPEGAGGRDGVFVKQRPEELYAILSLESHRYQSVIVGENLGLVPPEVNEGLRRHGLEGMYVQMFELTGDAQSPVKPPPADTVAAFATHDLPPFAAFWADRDIAGREHRGQITPEQAQDEATLRMKQKLALVAHLEERDLLPQTPDTLDVYRGALALLAESDARHVLLSIEDAWGEERSQNVPGTTSEEHANWTGRATYSLEEFDSVAGLTEALNTVSRHRKTGSGAPARETLEGG